MTANSAAELQIQWVEFVYNTTDGNAGTPAPPVQPPPWGWNPGIPSNPQTCGNICSIDHTSKMGTPVLVQEPQSKKQPYLPSVSLFSLPALYYLV